MKRLAERLYEARKMRERVPSEFLPLFDHLLNLAADSAKHGRPQRAGIELRKAEQLAKRKTSSYYDPHTEGGHLHKRTGYRDHRRFGYLNERDLHAKARQRRGDIRREMSRDETRGALYSLGKHYPGYSISWRKNAYGDVRWTVHGHGMSNLGGTSTDLDAAIQDAKYALQRMKSREISRDVSRRSKRTTKYPRTVEHKVSRKIALLREEGYSAKQAAAIAYRMYGIGRVGRSTRTTKRRSARRIYRRRG